jgi:pantoate kinase
MNAGSVCVPASITCFFTPEKNEDFCKTGSYGVGIALRGGAKAEFTYSDSTKLTIEGCKLKTVELGIELLKSRFPIRYGTLNLESSYPIGCGLGMSAALTLSALLAVAKTSNILQIADVAHEAEIRASTGLGDVVTQTFGGVLCRLNAACPSKAEVRRIELLKEVEILVLGKLDTEEMLREYDFSSGKKHLRDFIKNPTVESLFYHSKSFANESGVMDGEILDIVEAVEANGGLASMVMLGKAVFAVNGFEALKEFGRPFKAKVDRNGLVRGGRSL